MNCPNCSKWLRTIEYEGIEIETCDGCGGEWLDAHELGKVTRIRQVKFNDEERRAIAQSTTITGVDLLRADRDLVCPKCGSTTDAINYGGDTGIVVDRCTACGGFWLDEGELEKVQMVIEGWDDCLPDDLRKYGKTLRDIEVKLDQEDDVVVSRLPLVGRFINMCVNGILDIAL